MGRRILHVDMDAFFASVEQVLNPALKGKPLIVGGDQESRGVVCTASYEARVYGIHSGMPMAKARRLCPHGIYLKGSYGYYKEASEQIRAILDTVSPVVQMASIDEGYVDITGSRRLFGGEEAIARYVKGEILERTSLPSTVAISSNKLVSKIASGEAKPDGYISIPEGEEKAYLRPLSIGKLRGVGPRTQKVLESLGILTIGCLADLPLSALLDTFGPMGYAMQRSARGISTSSVEPYTPPKSISRETTFQKDLINWSEIEPILIYLAERAAYTLRQKEMETKTVTLKVRYADFETKTFAKGFPEPTCLDRDIIEVLHTLIPKAAARRTRVRLIGVALSSLSYNQHQLHLFGKGGAEQWERALESVDRIREKHGFQFLRTAKSIILGRKVELTTPSLSR